MKSKYKVIQQMNSDEKIFFSEHDYILWIFNAFSKYLAVFVSYSFWFMWQNYWYSLNSILPYDRTDQYIIILLIEKAVHISYWFCVGINFNFRCSLYFNFWFNLFIQAQKSNFYLLNVFSIQCELETKKMNHIYEWKIFSTV